MTRGTRLERSLCIAVALILVPPLASLAIATNPQGNGTASPATALQVRTCGGSVGASEATSTWGTLSGDLSCEGKTRNLCSALADNDVLQRGN
jgi:uncharacterized membrane protein